MYLETCKRCDVVVVVVVVAAAVVQLGSCSRALVVSAAMSG
jgi:hypothetical protein